MNFINNFLQDGDKSSNNEDIGEIFQDHKNMAAILMRKHEETGDLLMVSDSKNYIILEYLRKKPLYT